MFKVSGKAVNQRLYKWLDNYTHYPLINFSRVEFSSTYANNCRFSLSYPNQNPLTLPQPNYLYFNLLKIRLYTLSTKLIITITNYLKNINHNN